MEFFKNTDINKQAIELVEGKQASYASIYTLSLVKFKILKTYIKTYRKTGFIQPSKLLVGASIFFDKKPNSSFRLCVDY